MDCQFQKRLTALIAFQVILLFWGVTENRWCDTAQIFCNKPSQDSSDLGSSRNYDNLGRKLLIVKNCTRLKGKMETKFQ